MKYKTTLTITSRTQSGNAAQQIAAGYVFESNATKIIRDVLHRKIEDGRYLNLYVPAISCVEYTAPPPVEPPVTELKRMQVRYKKENGEWDLWKEWVEDV